MRKDLPSKRLVREVEEALSFFYGYPASGAQPISS